MPKSALNWKVAGPAGEGIKSTGVIFAKTCLRHGLSIFEYTEYPSLIRGGHNTYQVHAGMDKVYSQVRDVDLLVALNENTVKFNGEELTDSSVTIYDKADGKYDIEKYHLKGTIYDVPLVELAKSAGADRIMANNVALGVSMFLLGLDVTILDQVIADMFDAKGPTVVSLNQGAAEAGYKWASTNLKPMDISVSKQSQKEDVSISGNEALALGAIAGGMKAYLAYPMTPASSILHALADWSTKADVFVKHAEDEIGVINMALGMSYAGVRAACGSSGGGFCYMTEALGLSGIAELPLVIYESMRPGPAGGMPTWTAQGDLLFAISAAQDEFPRIVLSPGDVSEAFESSKLAFDLADKYQIPVIVLSDKQLSESNQSTHYPVTTFNTALLSREANPHLDETGFFPRYAPTATGGISPRSVPGQKDGFYIATSYEHDHHGISEENAAPRIEQMTKRMAKLDQIREEIPSQWYDGSPNPEITFISFGSTVGAIRQALPLLRQIGIDAAALNLSWVWPFPSEQVIKVIKDSKNPVVVEGNSLSQLAKLIAQETGINVYHKRTKFDGRPFYPHEIVQYAKEILHK